METQSNFFLASLYIYSLLSTPLTILIYKHRAPHLTLPTNAPLRQSLITTLHNYIWIFPILSAVVGLVFLELFVYETVYVIPISKWSQAAQIFNICGGVVGVCGYFWGVRGRARAAGRSQGRGRV